MVDISVLDKYKLDLTPFQITFIANEIKSNGLEKVIEYYYYTLDCSRINNNGIRLMQTPTHPYSSDLSELLYVIDTYIEEQLDKDKYHNKLIELHLRNLKFEEDNPPINYLAKRKGKSKSKIASDKPKVQKEPKVKKNSNLSSAEAKLREVGLRISNLKLKL